MPKSEVQTRIESSYQSWLAHRQLLEPHKVDASDRRTTASPPVDIAALFPELAARTETSVRLHPRYGAEPPVDASKLGGTFIWPSSEPWPICPAHDIPFVPVLQLLASDFPEMQFPDSTDLFQMLWCPREHSDVPECRDLPCPMFWANPRFYWRNRAQITAARTDNPSPSQAFYEYVPIPCRLMPERVVESPSVYR